MINHSFAELWSVLHVEMYSEPCTEIISLFKILSTIVIIIICAMSPRVCKPVNSDKQSETAIVPPFDSFGGCWQWVSLSRMALGGNLFIGVPDICQRLWLHTREGEFDSVDISLNHTALTLLPREAIKEVSFLMHPLLQLADSTCCCRGNRSTNCLSAPDYLQPSRFERRQADEEKLLRCVLLLFTQPSTNVGTVGWLQQPLSRNKTQKYHSSSDGKNILTTYRLMRRAAWAVSAFAFQRDRTGVINLTSECWGSQPSG